MMSLLRRILVSITGRLLSLAGQRQPPPPSDPGDKTVVAVCGRCRASFLAYRGRIGGFNPTTILDEHGRIACPRCLGGRP